MFCKLAVRNVRRSVRDYAVYFLTLAFGVCLFYVFNSLEGQWVMQTLGRSQHQIMDAIMTFMNVFSVFVSVVLACLILYAHTFLMKRRKRELGTYFLLGLPTGQVSLLLVLETLLIGLLALGAGLALGVLLSQVLGLFTMSMFSASLAELRMVFSLPAVGKTVLYFGVIFLVVMAFTGISVSRARLLDLMQGARRNEELRERPLWVSAVLFLMGAAMLGTAYAMVLTRGILRIDALFFVMLGLGTLGTLLFFRALSGFLLRVVQGRRGLYYKGLNMFILRQWSSKVHSTYLSMTVICILLLLAIGITACSVGLNNTMEALTVSKAPYDVTVTSNDHDPDGLRPVEIEARLAQAGYSVGGAGVTFLLRDTGRDLPALSHTDYSRLMALRGLPGLAVEDLPARRSETFCNGSGWGEYLVLPDGEAAVLPALRQYYVENYPPGADHAALDAALHTAAEKAYALSACTRLDLYYETMGTKVLVLFLGLYLGVVFLLTAAAVLALQQLSQAADNAPRYEILTKLGADRRMRDGAVLAQVALAFFLPLGLAAIHAVVGMTAANAVIAEVGRVDSAASSLAAALLILLVYGGYFAATFLSSRRIAGGNR